MNNIKLIDFYVNPKIPDKLNKLNILCYNLWSTWDKHAIRLFNRIDPILYRQCNHNPVELIHNVSARRFDELANDRGFIFELNSVYKRFASYMNFRGFYYSSDDKKQFFDEDKLVAYFSMEYGLHESIPIYSGGLGVLSGDHLKAASDQGIPLIGIGLLYKFGYFSQKINHEGLQEETWKLNEWFLMPVKICKDEEDNDLIIKIKILGEEVLIKVWYISIGKIKLYLLDTDLPENKKEFRQITDKLYDSDREIRLMQEILISFGGLELINRLNLNVVVYHLNEGHSAFVIIERLRKMINEEKFTLPEAKLLVRNSTVFTTHTPVTEGNEHFKIELISKYLKHTIEKIGLSFDEFSKDGMIPDDQTHFWLPALAIKYSKYTNAVSKIHSSVSKELWHKLFPSLLKNEVPISYVTNGVHTQSWISKELSSLFDRYLGESYLHTAEDKSVWQNIKNIPDIEIWEAHKRRKEQMISFIRSRIELSHAAKKVNYTTPKKIRTILNPDILTIGFARRFAPYKRANLIISDTERILGLIKNNHKPVQFIFAGKAHPADMQGKKLIKELIDFAKIHNVEDRFVFVEDYDINVARHLVQGVDVWLNNPIKPFEASGTSGMKAGVNGVINLSVLDGWWPECYNGSNGWAINAGENLNNYDAINYAEAHQVYDLIEDEITELYYRRDETNIPSAWIEKMKNSIYTVGMGFNFHRMLRQYIDKYYIPCYNSTLDLKKNDYSLLKSFLEKEKQIFAHWEKVYVKDFFPKTINKDTPYVNTKMVNSGDTIQLEAYVFLDEMDPALINVEIFYQYQQERHYQIIPMKYIESYKDRVAKFEGEVKIVSSGLQGFNVRIAGKNNKIISPYYNYMKWKEF